MFTAAKKTTIYWTADILRTTKSLPLKICDVRAHVKEFPIMRSTAEKSLTPHPKVFSTTSFTPSLVPHMITCFFLNPLINKPNNRKDRLKNVWQNLQKRKHLENLAAEGRIK
jgi:hypothetical protein